MRNLTEKGLTHGMAHTLQQMTLHEYQQQERDGVRIGILRVPGGWLYTFYSSEYHTTQNHTATGYYTMHNPTCSCFIPYTKEYWDNPCLLDTEDIKEKIKQTGKPDISKGSY